VTSFEGALLVGGGLFAGLVNTLAGGGSLLTVPLLVVTGLPGTIANGTNRIGVLVQSAAAVWRFRAEGVWDVGRAGLEITAAGAGALLGAAAVSQADDALVERAFALLMIVLLPTVLGFGAGGSSTPVRRSAPVRALIFFGIGVYGGAFQAGVGLLLVFALSYGGYDLVRSNGIKAAINLCFTLFAVPIFILQGQVVWPQALALALGFAAGGELGARVALRGGERIIRPVLVVAVLALAGHMLGLY
jgi:uncharacterized membrane protein YfcA